VLDPSNHGDRFLKLTLCNDTNNYGHRSDHCSLITGATLCASCQSCLRAVCGRSLSIAGVVEHTDQHKVDGDRWRSHLEPGPEPLTLGSALANKPAGGLLKQNSSHTYQTVASNRRIRLKRTYCMDQMMNLCLAGVRGLR
jgi:hypothetical protein